MSFRLVALPLLVLVGCSAPTPPPPPQAGPLRAAVATRKLEAPVGVPMGGYLRTRPASDPGSPWARQFPASKGVHTEPTVRVLALTNGLTRVVFVRLDTPIVSPTLRARTIAALTAAGESAKVFIWATHSHAGPARFMPPARLGSSTGTDFVSLVMDHYDLEIEARFTKAIVEATTEAFSKLEPVSFGVATADGSEFNSDRRCENDPIYGRNFRDTDLTVIRFDVVNEQGERVHPLTALVQYAMHGTVLGGDNTLFSTEAPGALELYASDLTGVPVIYVQGAAGDVSPRGDALDHGDLQRLEFLGRTSAALAKDAFDRAAPGAPVAQARLDFFERGVLVSRAAIGYAEGEYPEGGALQCAAGGEGACGEFVSQPEDVVCLPLERRRAARTPLSLVRLGEDLLFLSLPGEPGTGLSRKLHTALAPLGASRVLTVGYAQDHFGYLLEADDWLRGGYEPTVSAWGWKFGPYLLAETEAFVASIDQTQTPADQPATPEPESLRPIATPANAPRILTEPQDGARLTTHEFVFEGGDPALGLPQVALEVHDGTRFVPVMASPTRAVVNGPELLVRYAATPTYKSNPDATARQHAWTVQFETIPSTPLGRYRLVARGKSTDAYELVSREFTVTKSVAASARARLTADGRIAVSGRFPPNPTVSMGGEILSNYRLRDADATPQEGARLLGSSTVTVTLRAPDLSTSMAQLTWSDAESAWVSSPLAQAGAWQVVVAAGALTDRHGNETGAAATLDVTK
jgi:neutral ceramidase